MIRYPYVEDYLELLGGYIPNGLMVTLSPSNQFINLARYDEQVVESMSVHTMFNGALTDRQAYLACRLILKYRRQFAAHNIDVGPVESPQYRLPLRIIDRTRSIQIIDNKLVVKFNYDKNMITQVREYVDKSQGNCKFNSDVKLWVVGITEANVNWFITWGKQHQFDISDEALYLMQLIVDCEQIEYKIELVTTETGFEITNAAPSLINYVTEKLGGFGASNVITLIDNAGLLGYSVNEDLLQHYIASHGNNLDLFKSSQHVHLSPSEENLSLILDYAEIVNRYPIYVYDPLLYFFNTEMHDFFKAYFCPDQILRVNGVGKKKNCEYDIGNIKLIYVSKIPSNWEHPIPLLITTQELMFGGARTKWQRRAEKIIYFCQGKLLNL